MSYNQSSSAPVTQNRRDQARGLMRQLTHGPAGLALVDQAVISAANFATNIIVGRAVAETDFGAYILALSLLYFAKGVQEALVAAPFIVFRQRKTGADLASYRGSNAAYQAATSAALLLAVPCIAMLLAWVGASKLMTDAAWIMLAAAPFLMLREYLRRVSFAEFRFGLALSMDVVTTFLQLTGLMLVWRLDLMSPLAAFAMMGLACFSGATIWILRRPVDVKLDRARVRDDWRSDWAFGRWALVTYLVGCSTPFMMPWVLGVISGDIAVARLGACQTLVGLANMFIVGVNNLLGPQAAKSFAEGGGARLLRTVSKAVMVYTFCLGSFCVLVWFWGDLAAGLAFGDKYPGLQTTMLLLAGALLLISLKGTGGIALSAMHKPKLNIPADIAMLVVSLTAGIVLTQAFAETGTAAGIALGAASACMLRWWMLLRCLSSNECRAKPTHFDQQQKVDSPDLATAKM